MGNAMELVSEVSCVWKRYARPDAAPRPLSRSTTRCSLPTIGATTTEILPAAKLGGDFTWGEITAATTGDSTPRCGSPGVPSESWWITCTAFGPARSVLAPNGGDVSG